MAKTVIIDTNLWISYLISDDYKWLDNLIIENKIVLIFSVELFEEFLEVINRPKLKKYFKRKDLDNLLSLLGNYSEIINVKSKVKICRDPNDDFLLALAKDSNSNYLITGDKALLDVKKFGKTKILTISDFKKL